MKTVLTVLASISLAAGVLVAQSPRAADLYQEAVHLDEVKGDSVKAIPLYRSVVERFPADRRVASNAQLHLAQALDRLGKPEARAEYEKVLRDFAELPVAASARSRLAVLQTAAAGGASLRRVQSDLWLDDVSLDGRWGAGTTADGDVEVIDLQSWTRRTVGRRPKDALAATYARRPRFSHDGRQLGYIWTEVTDGVTRTYEWQIRLVATDGSTAPRVVYRNPNIGSHVVLNGWTPDDRKLLIQPDQGDNTWQLALLPIAGGALQPIKSFQWNPVNASLSPDGKYIAYDAPVGDSVNRDVFILAVNGSQDSPLVQHPAADAEPTWSPDGSQVLFVSNRTRTPSLWGITVRDGKPAGEPILLKEDFPMGGSSGTAKPVTRDGALYFNVRHFRTNVYHVALRADGKAAGPAQIATNHAVDDNCCAALSPDGTRLAYFSRSPKVLVVKELGSGAEREYPLDVEITTVLDKEVTWMPDSRSVLVIANGVPGSSGLHRVDLATGRAELVMRDPGTHYNLARDGKSIVTLGDGGEWLRSIDLRTHEEKVVREHEPGMFYLNPEVSPDGTRIAYWRWRRGPAPVSQLVVSNIDGGAPRVACECAAMANAETAWPNNIHTWTPDHQYIVFVDKDHELVRVAVSGGTPEPLGIKIDGRIMGPQMQQDGRGIYFSVNGPSSPSELWVLEHFLPSKQR